MSLLIFVPDGIDQAKLAKEIINKSNYLAEYNDGVLYFKEEPSCMDALEEDLSEIFINNKVDGFFTQED